ncbi:FAD-dependent isoamyl alcohol oxidase [Apiospora phragmitis]|uniref:FAD-dependent isoamyl alcohol oxidase n=1 Tax=Apiospora phragmitis TaxID=2905665 RepID=A0ABR1UKT3_9PEZI
MVLVFSIVYTLGIILGLCPYALTVSLPTTRSCKLLPEDHGWPATEDWETLNQTVGGSLIATVPLATVYHGTNFDQDECLKVQQGWPFADAHVAEPAEFLAPYFQNQSCDPFTPRNKPCELGNYAHYSINATEVRHIQEGIRFSHDKNIRLTIKSSGHDLLGKSTGKGSLSIWTHNFKTIEFIDQYYGSPNYTGSAVRLGPGVLTADATAAASARGLRVVTGTCPSVSIAGGYTSGGGHGVFTSQYGMAADNVLEWEVVTPKGEHLVATPQSHQDLYWALSGGGPGTFAVVVSMVTRTYKDGIMEGATLSFDTRSTGGIEQFWNAVTAFQSSLGPVVDAGTVLNYVLTPTSLNSYGLAIADGNESKMNKVIQPVMAAIREVGVSLNVTKTTHNSYMDFFNHYFLDAVTQTPSAQITGGRIVPRHLMERQSTADKVTQALRQATESGFNTICGAVNANKPRLYLNAVLPLWRSALLHCIFVKSWDFTVPRNDMVDYQKRLTNQIMPKVEAATPGGGSYLNEANFEQPGWQHAFYGSNYPRLRKIKQELDPLGVLFAQTAVGSEMWTEDADGRLCRI